MKRNLVLLFVGASMVMACQQNQIDVQQGEDDVFYASIENDDRTRTTLDENNNVMWSANDLLTVFKKSSINSKYQVTTSSVGKTTGTFTKVYGGKDDEFTAGGELGHNVAVYPYQDQLAVRRADNSEPASRYEIEGMVLPEEQEYVANSFAEGAFPMAAVSLNNELVFRNVCGGIKLQLKGTQKVTSIKIQGNDGEKLAGNAVLTVYADEDLNPVLTMASNALKSVTLDCGNGVQLTESYATEFIIVLPPLLFSKGFTATVTASNGQTYTVQTGKANTVLRSSLLVMPSVKLGSPIGEDDEDEIAVGQVTLNKSSLVLAGNFEYTLIAKVSPIDATDQSVTWASDNPAVVSVNQNGGIKTISSGTANVTAEAGGVTATCSITVIEQTAYATIDYIDEYGVNHGKGIAIGDVVWAPVNCGYKLPTDDNKGFQYGKLYQWGRKYGQGHNNDELVPVFVEGPISVNNGQNEQYANTFFVLANGHDWAMPKDDSLWNSGTEENPIKTEYDPCPEGWRVPTSTELFELGKKHNPKGLPEYFTGNYTYFDDIPNVMLPNNPFRWDSGEEYNYGRYECYYWSSSVRDEDYVHALNIGVSVYNGVSSRANGCSVRCVQE